MSNLSQTQINVIKPQTNYRYVVMLLLAGVITINYVDRVNIGVAAPTLMKLFELSPAQMGILMSAFFWSYVGCMLPIGWLLNRMGPKMIMFWSCLGWGLSTALTAAVSGFNSFFAVRVLLGVTESGVYPTCTRVASAWTPLRERTTATGIFDACSRLGNAVAPPLVVWALLKWGWQMSFVITGGLAVVYAFIWLYFYHEPENHPKVSQSELDYIRQDQITETNDENTKHIPILQLLTYKPIFLMSLGFFLYMYFWTTFNMWIPAYLVQAKGFSLKTMGFAAMYPYIAGVISEAVGGYILDKWYQGGASLNLVRRTGQVFGMLGGAIALYLAVVAATPDMTVLWLTVSMGVISFSAAQGWAIPTNIAPKGNVGTVAAMQGTIGNLASIAGPMVTGYVIGTSYGYDGALMLLVAGAAGAALVYSLIDYSKPVVPR
ncbi:MAG: putative transporter [Firmicutes bacterium]|nr:putative transporter [Bacillota bacterium]